MEQFIGRTPETTPVANLGIGAAKPAMDSISLLWRPLAFLSGVLPVIVTHYSGGVSCWREKIVTGPRAGADPSVNLTALDE